MIHCAVNLRQAKRACIALVLHVSISAASVQASSCKPTEAHCPQQLQTLYQTAQTLIQQQHYEQAADILEQLLLQAPDYPNALGSYQQLLQALQQPLTPPQSGDTVIGWQRHASVQYKQSASNNLNHAPQQASLWLTLPGQTLPVTLDAAFRPQSGMASDMALSGQAQRALGQGLSVQLSSDLIARQTDYSGYANYQSLNLASTLLQQRQHGGDTALTLAANALHYGNDVTLYALFGQLRHSWAISAHCAIPLGTELLWQRQHNVDALDSRYTGLITGLTCATNWGQYQLSLGGGNDWAKPSRPGADQWRGRIALQAQWSLSAAQPQALLTGRIGYLSAVDSQGYSTLLANNATRNHQRLDLGLNLDWPLSAWVPHLIATTSLNWQQQTSNISLFQTHSLEGGVGLKLAW